MRLSVMLLVVALLFSACSAASTESPPLPATAVSPSPTEIPPTLTATATLTPVPPTATASPTFTPNPTATPVTTETPTATPPPPTPSGDEAIYVYYVQLDSGGSVGCGDSLVPLNTGLARTGDIEEDVAAALRRLFSKTPRAGELVNPAYLSNIEVESVTFKAYTGLVDVRLDGTYVRSGDRCDDSRVREQVWTTIRQFPGVKTVYILLNENLLGDILATGK